VEIRLHTKRIVELLGLVLLYFLLTDSGKAAQRELASEGESVALSIDAAYQCSNEALIRIDTQSVGYFDSGADLIQNLSDTSRAVLGFECPSIEKINFEGYTNDVLVFSADTSEADGWVLQSEPARLEEFALFFSLREPSLLNLGALYALKEPYQDLPGIEDSYQFQFYESQLKRLSEPADIETFAQYLDSPGIDLGTFKNAKAHFESVMSAIEKYRPDLSDSYSLEYFTRLASLKDAYWSSQVSAVLDDFSLTFSEILELATEQIQEAESEEFTQYFDAQIAQALKEEIGFLEESLPDSSLGEISFVTDFLVTLPEEDQAELFPITEASLNILPDQIVPVLENRREALVQLAMDTIQESGSTYLDVDPIIETGFALAGEFEDAGYPAEAESFIVYTINHIEHVLEQDLPIFNEELTALELDDESATALQQQASAFQELAEQFPAYVDYAQSIESKLITDRQSICQSILRKADVSDQLDSTTISLTEIELSVNDLACTLYENNHLLTGLVEDDTAESYTLTVFESSEQDSVYRLQTNLEAATPSMNVIGKLEGDDATADQQEAEMQFHRLIEPPPNGQPDSNGVRECDVLGADPFDPNRLADGQDFEDIDLDPDLFDRAIDACIAAVEDDPADARQQFQLGRILWFAGDIELASEYINLAVDQDYVSAKHYQAELLLNTSEDPDIFIDALDLYEAAAANGYTPSLDMVKEMNPDGLDFYKEIPPPTPDQILAALPQRSAGASMGGMSNGVTITGIDLKECFQTSATEFSCEFKMIARCGMSGTGQYAALAKLFSMAVQADCDRWPFEFGDFRKLSQGNWKQL